MNEILQTLDGRSVLRMERRLAHPAEKVWRAITEPSHLAAWFPSQVEMPELVVGGKLRFVFGDDEGPTLDGEIAPRVVCSIMYPLRWTVRNSSCATA